jgi:hypothetical protein
MAVFSSGADAILLAIKYYESEKGPGENFSRWAARQAKELLSAGLIVDAASRLATPSMHHYRMTDNGNQYLHNALYESDGDQTTGIPGFNFADNFEMLKEIQARNRRGARSIFLPNLRAD